MRKLLLILAAVMMVASFWLGDLHGVNKTKKFSNIKGRQLGFTLGVLYTNPEFEREIRLMFPDDVVFKDKNITIIAQQLKFGGLTYYK